MLRGYNRKSKYDDYFLFDNSDKKFKVKVQKILNQFVQVSHN